MNNDDQSWRAQDTVTGELCPHHHHTTTAAKRCGNNAFFPHKVKAVRWENPEEGNKKTVKNRGAKYKAQWEQADLSRNSGILDMITAHNNKEYER